MKTRILSGLLLLAITFVPATHAWAGDVLNRINETQTLRVGMTGSQPPFNFQSKSGELMGMDVDLAGLLAGSMGVELDIVQLPFSELIGALEAGKVDLVLSGMTATLKRNLRVAFVGPYYISGKSMLTKSTTIAAIQQAEEINLKAISIATLSGSTGEAWVKRNVPNARLVSVTNYDDGIKLLLDDDVDAFLADAPIIMLTAMRYPQEGLAALTKPLTIEPIGMAVAPDDPLMMNLVENYLSAMDATGVLDALLEKWFQSGGWLVHLP